MKVIKYLNNIALLVISLGLILGGLLAGCGSADSLRAMQTTGTTETGTVAILLTDGPTDQFSAVNVTVNEVSLLSEHGETVIIFSGSRRVNLLALQDAEDLFTITDGVPIGAYNKIRLRVSEPEFVPFEGDSIMGDQIQLVGDGNVDIALEHPIEVFPDETLVIRLDLDAEKSILIHFSDTDSPIFQFRPVIFVEILRDLDLRLVSLRGEIETIDDKTHSFLLRRVDPIFHVLIDDKPVLASEDGDADHIRPYLLRVMVLVDTRIFEADGQPGDFDSLEVGQHVHVRGLLSFEDGIHLKAKLIEIGQFIRMHGEITTGINVEKRFGFTPDPGQGVTGEILVQVHGETLIFEAGTHRRLTPEDLVAGKQVLIEGVLDVGGEPDLLHAAVIVVKPPEAEVIHLQGIISDLNPEARTFNLAGGPPCAFAEPPCLVPLRLIPVHVMPDALILRIHPETVDNGDHSLGIEVISFEALKDGDMVHVFGQFDPTGSPFHAKVVLVEGSF